ncbi:MAG: aminopeptidase P family protein [Tannerellaceae bacterium]|jgi:Xaa-Pro aminopeptidase|nr:aminopeptidase P family protein [Tannerellaceae bacterium]
MTTTTDRLFALRDAMKRQQLDAYILTDSDPHLSEYTADRWKVRTWFSGFTGSAGTLVVTADKAVLWTDSRYFIQAEIELADVDIDIWKIGFPETPSIADFLRNELVQGQTVGVCGQTYSAALARPLEKKLAKSGIRFDTSCDLAEGIWQDRPAFPNDACFLHEEQYSGRAVLDKLSEIRAQLQEDEADAVVLTALDDVAWTFNIRGYDIAYNPVVISYGFVSQQESILFIDTRKVPEDVFEYLQEAGVSFLDYDAILPFLSQLPEGTNLSVDLSKASIALINAIPQSCSLVEGFTSVTRLKCIKNEVEIEGIRNASVRDGVALTKFHMWLEQALRDGERVTELTAAEKLSGFRAEQELYLMDSFHTICAYADHGAIVHYSATPQSDAIIQPEGLLLIDSGGQYLDGTTDITRTIALGAPSDQMREDFTCVLKAMIGLAKCKFPEGTFGGQLDALARKHLWDAGLNYLHGTSHGIGHCLNVHEGPQTIRLADTNPTPLKMGMVLSNEPGLYRHGEYGIRIENMMLVRDSYVTADFGAFLHFDPLTLFYIDERLLLVPKLSISEVNWLYRYQQRVFGRLRPFLDDAEGLWLRRKTSCSFMRHLPPPRRNPSSNNSRSSRPQSSFR